MPDPAEPTDPKSLGDPMNLAARHAALDAEHVAPLLALARRISAERSAPVPAPDPIDGGTRARLLLLLETPGPAIGRTGIVSRDNPTGTAANLFRFLRGAGIARRDILIWNAIPWLIHAPAARNRAPRRAECALALPYLAPLLDAIPGLVVAVLAGRFAGETRPELERLRPRLPILGIPHPSPTYVCTSPDVGARIRAGFEAAARILASSGGPVAAPEVLARQLAFGGRCA